MLKSYQSMGENVLPPVSKSVTITDNCQEGADPPKPTITEGEAISSFL